VRELDGGKKINSFSLSFFSGSMIMLFFLPAFANKKTTCFRVFIFIFFKENENKNEEEKVIVNAEMLKINICPRGALSIYHTANSFKARHFSFSHLLSFVLN
jgi:hypothetical protein